MPPAWALDFRVLSVDASRFQQRGDPAVPVGEDAIPSRNRTGIMERHGMKHYVVRRKKVSSNSAPRNTVTCQRHPEETANETIMAKKQLSDDAYDVVTRAPSNSIHEAVTRQAPCKTVTRHPVKSVPSTNKSVPTSNVRDNGKRKSAASKATVHQAVNHRDGYGKDTRQQDETHSGERKSIAAAEQEEEERGKCGRKCSRYHHSGRTHTLPDGPQQDGLSDREDSSPGSSVGAFFTAQSYMKECVDGSHDRVAQWLSDVVEDPQDEYEAQPMLARAPINKGRGNQCRRSQMADYTKKDVSLHVGEDADCRSTMDTRSANAREPLCRAAEERVSRTSSTSMKRTEVVHPYRDRAANVSDTTSWAYPDSSSVASTRGRSLVPTIRNRCKLPLRGSAENSILIQGGSAIRNGETIAASSELRFPVFDDKTWHIARKWDPSLPSYRRVEHLGRREERDLDLWLGFRHPTVVKLPSKVLLEHIPIFRRLLRENSQFYLGKSRFATPFYAACIGVKENHDLAISTAENLRNIGEGIVDHTKYLKHDMLDFLRALCGEDVHDVDNFHNALKQMMKYFDCPAAISRCLKAVEDRQEAELEVAVKSEPRAYLKWAYQFGARKTFKMAFCAVSQQAARLEDNERYLRGVPSSVRYVVEMKVGMLRCKIVEDNIWARAWQAMDAENQSIANGESSV